MSDHDLERKKKVEAAAKAREEALKKRNERKEQVEANEVKALKDDLSAEEKAKAKAAAAAKAKAAAVAKAKALAITKQKDNKEVENPEAEKESPANQLLLEEYKQILEGSLGRDAIEEAYVNTLSKFVPTIIVKKELYYQSAECLKKHELLNFDYLLELHGTDMVTHMEVYVYLYSHKLRRNVALKVKLDREHPTVPSLVPLWAGANWPECEAYDLLGIQFENHPELKRILLGEDWVGYPLRKDYEPYDVEV